MDDDTLVKLAFKENVQSNCTWCKTIQILNTSFQLHTQDWSANEFPDKVKKKVKSDFVAYWKGRIENPEVEKKLALYSKVKQGFLVQKYLEMPSFRNRQIMSKILCSNHKLRIETGRHIATPREERLCQLCEMNKIEDENHFIRECPTFDQIRRDSPIPFENYNNTESIFHIEEPPVIAEFLRAAYRKRDQLVTVPPDIYRVKHKSKDGMKLLLCKGKNTPGRLKIQKITKDGLN